ncbi:hypothetical protein ABG067_006726 [Albugo candida]
MTTSIEIVDFDLFTESFTLIAGNNEINDNDTEMVQNTGDQLDAEASIICVETKRTTNVNEKIDSTRTDGTQELTEIPAISILSRLEDTVGDEAFSDVEGDETNDMDDVDSDVTRVVSLNVQIVLENLKVKTDDQEDVQRVSGNSTRTEVELNEDYGPEISETDIMSTISDIQNEGNEAFEIHF